MDPLGLLRGLDPDQRRAVSAESDRLAVLAGPGTGKTRVLTRRVAWRIASGSAEPARTLVVTFTRRAAVELRERLRNLGLGSNGLGGSGLGSNGLGVGSTTGAGTGADWPEPGGATAGVTVSTLHALALATLQRHGHRPALARYPLRLVAPLVRSEELGWSARQVAAEISWAKARCLDPDRYIEQAAGRVGSTGAAGVADVFRAYEAVKAARGVVDVDDLLPLATELLRTDAAVAAAVRWHHHHVLVDEFQDLSRAAYRLLRAVTGDDPDLCVVGDPDQAVYGFAGSDHRLLTRLGEDIPDLTVVRLRRSHRCPPTVLAAALAVLEGRRPAEPVPAPGTKPESPARPVSDPGRAARPAGPEARWLSGSGPAIGGHPDGEAEAAAVVWQIRQARAAGRSWTGLAVLARTNSRLDAVAFACERAGIPTRSRRHLLDRPEARRSLDALLQRPMSLPAYVVSSEVRDLAAAEPSSETLAALADLAAEYATVPGGTLDGYLAWLDGTVRARGGEPVDREPAVDLLTFHRAKGLEWSTVFVIGVEAGTVPFGRFLTSDELAEERRLVYVALTRASTDVRVSWAGPVPSPWMTAIAGAVSPDHPLDADQSRVAVGRIRAQLSDPSDLAAASGQPARPAA